MSSPTSFLTEKEFQSEVLRIAKTAGWIAYHTHDSRRSQPGFPDIVLVKDRVIFAELKTNTGKLSEAQKIWQEKLLNAGADFRVWRPKDLKTVTTELFAKK